MKKEKVSADLKDVLYEQSKDYLVKLIVKQANKHPEFLSSLILEFGERKEYEQELFTKYKQLVIDELDGYTRYKANQLHAYHTISNAIKQLNEFCKHSKNKEQEAELLMMILEYIFNFYKGDFGTCHTKFDNKVAITLQRTINVVQKKLHPDIQIEYLDKLNVMLEHLKEKSGYLDSVFKIQIA